MAKNNIFKLKVPYNGEMVEATITEYDIPLVCQFDVDFPDGYSTTFFYYDDAPEENNDWREQTLGVTELSKNIGVALEEYLSKKYSTKDAI